MPELRCKTCKHYTSTQIDNEAGLPKRVHDYCSFDPGCRTELTQLLHNRDLPPDTPGCMFHSMIHEKNPINEGTNLDSTVTSLTHGSALTASFLEDISNRMYTGIINTLRQELAAGASRAAGFEMTAVMEMPQFMRDNGTYNYLNSTSLESLFASIITELEYRLQSQASKVVQELIADMDVRYSLYMIKLIEDLRDELKSKP